MGAQTSALSLTKEELNLSNAQWIDYLIHGYLRRQYDTLDYLLYEISLIRVITTYLNDAFLIFDIYPLSCKSLIRECGTIFTRKAHDHDYLGLVTIGSSKGWSKGIHKLSIRSMTYAHMFDAFGICTNIHEFSHECKWYTDGHECEDYVALNGCCVVSKYKIPEYTKYTIRTGDCQPGDVIWIVFDGSAWTVSFWFNGEQIGEPMNITPNMAYYPFISSNEYNNHNAEYHLVYDHDLD
mmetsp:Transcript_49368/g.78807  ORF Transcript_49368/g.78807 Transcript_49368/m.78807 type:complete len:238 (+) Transcript_49368:47-760(+)|eukprot:CAMPEP_0197028366 /NCGR_PEP_ID=MMETSP1384-20130603/8074_1 /TAXON_ID=29189 /ORGANISM="Ammonia sp." /LENGTH=237 /DNA_ID=CAMNT_0042457365 /DNA_START=43 /DNA_END=756 /DNA_ORIENTATION=+